MSEEKNTYYALALLSCAIAKADGKVQPQESQLIRTIINKEMMQHHISFNYMELIDDVLNKTKLNLSTNYHWAISEIKKQAKNLSPEVKNGMLTVLEQVAKAFPPVTDREQEIIDLFKSEVIDIAVEV